MSEQKTLIVNTGPLIALAAATGTWEILRTIPWRIIVPIQVIQELSAGKIGSPGHDLIGHSPWIEVHAEISIPVYLQSSLDTGEAAVIALALEKGFKNVAIDERAGRATARACGLQVTGSLGILLLARQLGAEIQMTTCIERIIAAGIWISPALAREVIALERQY